MLCIRSYYLDGVLVLFPARCIRNYHREKVLVEPLPNLFLEFSLNRTGLRGKPVRTARP